MIEIECLRLTLARPRVGVAIGFDSGDMLKIGELTETGFVRVHASR
jgi:hypothetical protein